MTETVVALERLRRQRPRWTPAYLALARALAAAERLAEAAETLQQALELDPQAPMAWLVFADVLYALGRRAEADAGYMRHLRVAARHPTLLAAGQALHANDIPEAEAHLRLYLKSYPTDIAAIRMLAEVAGRISRYAEAQSLLERCLELAPSFEGARHNYANVLHLRNRPAEALDQIEILLEAAPDNPGHKNLKASVLAQIGDFEGAIAIYEALLADFPVQARLWMNFGHALKSAGQEARAIDAYRRSAELEPQTGEAFWNLANLKTFQFTEAEVEAMSSRLAGARLSDEDRLHFHFALGKALEDRGQYARSFAHYQDGNQLRLSLQPYDPSETSGLVERSKATLTASFFAERRDFGADAPDPIFIVGLPRSGSTLVEQILSSHSAVEGTMELADLSQIVKDLRDAQGDSDQLRYPQILERLTAADFRRVGEQYLHQTRIQRRTDAPFFIDKMPNNFVHAGLIRLALPKAKVIDVRRHPLGCGFSLFKQHFARGQAFAYSLSDIGAYYRDYVALMAHMDDVVPGFIHRIAYEALVENFEAEVRRLLDYCGLEFEVGCLDFHKNSRAVRTASAQQVRRPIYKDATAHWRHFEPWLNELKAALADSPNTHLHDVCTSKQ